MLNRNVPLVVCLSLLSAAAFAQNPQGVGYAVEFASSGSGQFQVFPENAATFTKSSVGNTGPAGASQIVAKPDGSKFYIIGSTGIDSIDPAFTTPKAINGLSGSFTHAVISPDGRFLLVPAAQGSGGSNLYVLNTSTDTVALNANLTGAVIGAVVSRDATTVWVLTSAGGSSAITTISLVNLQQAGSPIYLKDPTSGNLLGGDPLSFSLSPFGLLYVTAGNEILQIDPVILQSCQASPLTCAPTTLVPLNATPGPLQFTPDGGYAYCVNQNPSIGGQALIRLTLPAVAGAAVLKTYPSEEVFDSIIVAGQNRIFAHSPGDTTLWDVATDLSSVTVSALQSVLPATTVYSVAISDELPSAQYLYAVAGGASLADVYLVNLSSSSATGEAASSLGQGPLQFVYVPSESPAGFNAPLTYNATQLNLAAGATAVPLIARVLDQNGNPVFAVPVTFSGDASLKICTATCGNPATTTTNADGYVQATVTVGSSPGSYPVTMTAGTGNNNVTATFALAIPGATNPGGGITGPNQLSIVTGNGMLMASGEFTDGANLPNRVPTVLLVDSKGNPLPGQAITFTVTGASIINFDGSTNDNGDGTYWIDMSAGYPGQEVPFAPTSINASATVNGQVVGSVTFVETVFQYDSNGLNEPTTYVKPGTASSASGEVILTGGEGDVLMNAFTVTVSSGAFGTPQPIPNIGVRIADASNPVLNGPGTCQGSPLSDQNGNITCNFIPACFATIGSSGTPIGLGTHGFSIEIGEYGNQTGESITITPGSTQTLSIPSNGGNNQSANPGSALPSTLTAVVTDQCGTPITGATVTWQVKSGSATLSTTSSVTAAGGYATTKVTLGSSAGPVTIVASINAATSVTYTETANAIVGSLSLVSGGGQSQQENTAFTQPLVFALKDNNGNPLIGFTVSLSLGGGSATLSTTSAVTNSLGQASVNVTGGNAPGTVTVTATYSTFSASATLTVMAPGPNVYPTSFLNAASLQLGLVPCGLATVTGTGLAPGVNGIVSGNTLGIGPLSLTLEGVTITVDGITAPILTVSNLNGVQQVNFQTPCEIPTGNGTVVVEVNSGTTTVTGVTVYPTQPGIFTFAGPGGVNYGWVISAANGSYLQPGNLAHAGQTYYLVATGLGQTSPAATTNSPGTGAQTISASQVVLFIDNIGVPVTSVQYLEGEVGEYIITFTIPTTANGQPFPTGANLPIQLGGITSGGQTIYDNSPVALPGID
jgi:uncharacterized protein (TIGR03437 family)